MKANRSDRRRDQETRRRLEQRTERMLHKDEATWRWFMFGMVLILAIGLTVVITLAVVER